MAPIFTMFSFFFKWLKIFVSNLSIHYYLPDVFNISKAMSLDVAIGQSFGKRSFLRGPCDSGTADIQIMEQTCYPLNHRATRTWATDLLTTSITCIRLSYIECFNCDQIQV